MLESLQLRSRGSRFWREYTRMRTAILFLIGVVLVVAVGSFVPQQETSAQARVDDFLQSHHNLNDLASHLGLPLTEVFVSPLFLGLLGSLYIALGACVIRRGRALVMRTVRGHRRTPQYWGEWGSWLFHSSLFLLLVAAVWGKATGFEGIMTITEGQRATEARSSFDTLREGFLFDGRHAGYQVGLNRFSVTYQPNGQPQDFVSNLTVYRDGRQVQTKDVRVNDFLGYDGVDFYQQDYGWAPHLVVRNPRGEVVFDQPVQFFGAEKGAEVGVLKVPGFGYTLPGQSQPLQLGARMVVFPDARTIPHVNADGSVDPGRTEYGPGGEQPRNPVLQVQLFVGDLGLRGGAPQSVDALDTSHMAPYFSDARPLPLPLGQSLALPLTGSGGCTAPNPASGCFSLSFVGLPQYSLFHVKKDDGVPLVYVAFGLVMVGLLTKLYLRPFLERRARRDRRVELPDYAWLASGAAEGRPSDAVPSGAAPERGSSAATAPTAASVGSISEGGS